MDATNATPPAFTLCLPLDLAEAGALSQLLVTEVTVGTLPLVLVPVLARLRTLARRP